MKLLYKTMILGAAMIGLTACDKTEDAYYPGPEPTDVLSVDGAIQLNADGNAQTLEVKSIASWDVEIVDEGNYFKVEPLSGKGDGTITVTSLANTSGTPRNAKLIVKARNFETSVTKDLIQAFMQVDMKGADYPVTPENGGDVQLNFISTVAWKFVVQSNGGGAEDKGDIGWLKFSPASPGEGEYNTISAWATWAPNYTESERVITLQLQTVDEKYMTLLNKIPDMFTLRQAAGTRPSGVTLKQDSVGMHAAAFSLSYSSKSRIERCGVYVSTEGEGERFVAANTGADGLYPETGTLSVSLTDLADNRTYTVRPYVENRVGETMGDNFIQFTTTLDPESIHYKGLELVSIDVLPGVTDVKIVVEFVTDVEIGDFLGMVGDLPLRGEIQNMTSDGRIAILFTPEGVLTPKSAYPYSVRIVCRDFDDHRIDNPVIDYDGDFMTKALVPSEGDNNPPSVN